MFKAAVITVSDKCSRGERVDTSGPMLCTLLAQNECEVVQRALVPDEKEQIQAAIRHAADELRVQLILTTGGTGFSPRDITPEATAELIERATPGLPELMRELQDHAARLPVPRDRGHPRQQPDRQPARQRKSRTGKFRGDFAGARPRAGDAALRRFGGLRGQARKADRPESRPLAP